VGAVIRVFVRHSWMAPVVLLRWQAVQLLAAHVLSCDRSARHLEQTIAYHFFIDFVRFAAYVV